MNRNAIIGTLGIGLLIILGVFIYLNNETPNTLVMGNVINTSNNNTKSSETLKVIGVPTVLTDADVAVSNSTAAVTGKVNPSGAFTTYWYEYGLTTSLSSKTSSQTIGSGFSTTNSPGYITGLKSNTEYYFRLNASNSYGVTQGAMFSFTTNSTPPLPGKVPVLETNSATNASNTTISLNGRVNPEGYTTGYWFEFGETTNLGNLTNYASAGSGTSLIGVTANITNLKPLTKYYYRIDAQNQFGTVVGSIANFTTSGPAGASKPIIKTNTATNIEVSSVTLNGKVDPNGADTTYWFDYSKDSLLSTVIGTVTADQTMNGADAAIGIKADVSGLSKNTKYYFRLFARNQYGTVIGNTVSFRTSN